MPYSPIVSLRFARAEAVVLRDFAADAFILEAVQTKNPALARILQDLVIQFEAELVEHHRPDYATVLTKMKDEVLELEVVGIPKDIVLRIRRDFSKSEHPAIVQMIRKLREPRLQRCALQISAGSLQALSNAIATALDDFRDLIVAAEYDRFKSRLFDFNRPFEEAACHDQK